jgi:hypothetical protein
MRNAIAVRVGWTKLAALVACAGLLLPLMIASSGCAVGVKGKSGRAVKVGVAPGHAHHHHRHHAHCRH